MKKTIRRKLTDEFKEEAVKLVTAQGTRFQKRPEILASTPLNFGGGLKTTHRI